MISDFNEEELEKIREKYNQVDSEYRELLLKYTTFKFSNDEAREYAIQGLMKRIRTMRRCIFNVFEITPPDNRDILPDKSNDNLCINLQSFIFNVFGSLDNIAWIWVKENSFDFNKINIGLKPKHKKLRDTLSPEFKSYISTFDNNWFKYLENYRDALAHRIPLYVPTFSIKEEDEKKYQEYEKQSINALLSYQFDKHEVLKKEQKSLGRSSLLMTHSFREKTTPVVFHAQILTDWITVVEIANVFYNEISSKAK